MSDKPTFYIDQVPLGPGKVVNRVAGFYARETALPQDVGEGLEKLHRDFMLVQNWLSFAYEQAARKDYVPEIPPEIKEIVCPPATATSAKQPKKKATGRTSKKKSQTRQSKKASNSNTSQKTA